MLEFAISSAPVQGLKEEGPIWVEAMPARIYKTPMYGEVVMGPDRLERMIQNFNTKVRGQDIAVNFDHGTDKAKGNKAAGWIKELTLKPSSDDPAQPSLFALVDFTDEAKKEGKDNQWKYFSLEWEDEWEDTDGNKFEDVIVGGGLTNRPVAKKTLPINFSETMWEELDEEEKKYFSVRAIDRMAGESKEWEHSEPGTGSPPAPREDEDGSDDPAITGGWRRDTPPIETEQSAASEKGGKRVATYEFTESEAFDLFKVLELEHDTKPEKVVEKIKLMFGELAELRKNEDATEQEKAFAEKYPQYWEEHTKLMEKNRNSEAKAFSEEVKSVRKAEGNGLKTINQGLSPVALEAVQETHKKFADKTVTQEDFENCIKKIMNGGLVQFGEIGSSGEDIPEVDTSSANGIQSAKKVFAEVMNKIKAENPDWDNRKVLDKAAKDHPDLFEASRVALPA